MERNKLATVTLLLLGLSATLAIVSLLAPDRLLHIALLAGGVAIVMGPSIRALSTRRLDLFEPIHLFAAGFFLFNLLRPAYILAYESPTAAELDTLARALLLIDLSFVVFVVGYYLSVGRAVARTLPAFRSEWEPRRVRRWLYLLFGVAIAAEILFFAQIRGDFTSYLAMTRGARNEVLTGTVPYAQAAARAIEVALILLGVTLVGRTDRKSRYGLVAAVAIYLLYHAATAGDRRLPMAVLAGLFVARHYLVRRVRVRTALILGTVLFVVSMAWTQFRSFQHLGADTAYEATRQTDPSVLLNEGFFRGDLAAFDNFMFIIDNVPGRMDYEYGATYYRLFLSVIPRSIWADKPENINRRIVRISKSSRVYDSGLSNGVLMVGEQYLNFGEIGILLGMLLYGVFYRAMYEYLMVAPRNRCHVFIYGTGYFIGIMEQLRGSFYLGALNFWLFVAFAIVAAFGITWRQPVARLATFRSG